MKKSAKWGLAVLGFTMATGVFATTFALADSQKLRESVQPATPTETPYTLSAAPSDEQIGNQAAAKPAEQPVKKLTDAVQPSLASLSGQSLAKASPQVRENAKEYILYQMLNTVDFFDTISGRVENAYGGNVYSFDFAANQNNATSYQKAMVNGALQQERYSTPEKTVSVEAKTRSVSVQSGSVTRQESYELAQPVSERYGTEEDGTPFCILRSDSTNLECASLCVLPQEITFSFLTDFDAWQIDGTVSYLNRNCIKLSGTPSSYHQNKLGITRFTMLVDYETGVLLKYEGYDANGNVADSITVSDIHIDETLSVPDMQSNPAVVSFFKTGQ